MKCVACLFYKTEQNEKKLKVAKTNLLSDDFSSSAFDKLASSSGRLNGRTSAFGKGMGLDGNVLGSEFFTSDNNLVDAVLALGDGLG
mmetsp:Transcript_3232/g.4878  ORF Transcript_3232/g.4878 Transcript_3232/m.4878 type:complete len:87 (+) Transcript_3232:312-572(+)